MSTDEPPELQFIFTRISLKLVNHLVKRAKPPPRNLTHDSSGALLKSSEEVANMWYGFLSKKFSVTQREHERAPLAPLPSHRSAEDALTREEFEFALKKLKCDKAAGPDGIPVEVFKHCDTTKEELYAFFGKYGRRSCSHATLRKRSS